MGKKIPKHSSRQPTLVVCRIAKPRPPLHQRAQLLHGHVVEPAARRREHAVPEAEAKVLVLAVALGVTRCAGGGLVRRDGAADGAGFGAGGEGVEAGGDAAGFHGGGEDGVGWGWGCVGEGEWEEEEGEEGEVGLWFHSFWVGGCVG